jgi:hypothetical protein
MASLEPSWLLFWACRRVAGHLALARSIWISAAVSVLVPQPHVLRTACSRVTACPPSTYTGAELSGWPGRVVWPSGVAAAAAAVTAASSRRLPIAVPPNLRHAHRRARTSCGLARPLQGVSASLGHGSCWRRGAGACWRRRRGTGPLPSAGSGRGHQVGHPRRQPARSCLCLQDGCGSARLVGGRRGAAVGGCPAMRGRCAAPRHNEPSCRVTRHRAALTRPARPARAPA